MAADHTVGGRTTDGHITLADVGAAANDPGLPDIADPDLYADGDPLPVWEQLRATAPVHWNDHPHGGGFWAVMTHAPAVQVYRDNHTFTSERGMRLGSHPQAVAAAAGRMLIVTDPPRHSQVRKTMNPAFTPRRTAALEHTMREVLEPLLDAALEKGTVDFVDEVAAVLPSAIVCHLMDIGQRERLSLVELSSTAFGSSLGANGCPVSPSARTLANAEIFRFYRDLLARRRAAPGEDVVSLLAEGMADGAPLTDQEILLNCNGLLTGANETTRLSSAAGLLALMDNPGQWQRLRDREVDLDTAVDEILRWSTPAMHVVRVARTTTVIGGQTVRAGEQVAIWNPSVNRDESVFDQPHTFDLGRRPNRHLAFGLGNHFCIGASLARVELRVFLHVLLDKVAGARLAGPIRRMRSNFMWGIESLPVTLQPH
ncbi:cytochrome P450 [Streptomyces sp. rh34]|uniref:cytochrome P450 n=1 Tax=Streptomyces sp. rh34 TaxID=2034272 RepID=UPI001C54D733|nr:cytochrome P450 [Streptomyces sp. rh34]